MEGLGLQDVESSTYDHPYFGQIFLASVFQVIHYPEALKQNPNDEPHSIELLYMVIGLLMGILAVLDFFLVFKIAEFRYDDRTVAFGSSVLFAVMPMSWMVRRVYLDSIRLPLLLSSILFAVYCASRLKRSSNSAKTYRGKGEEKKTGKHIYLVLA